MSDSDQGKLFYGKKYNVIDGKFEYILNLYLLYDNINSSCKRKEIFLSIIFCDSRTML